MQVQGDEGVMAARRIVMVITKLSIQKNKKTLQACKAI